MANRATSSRRTPAEALDAIAAEADALGVHGSAQRLREMVSELRADPDHAPAIAREVAEALARAREAERQRQVPWRVYRVWRLASEAVGRGSR